MLFENKENHDVHEAEIINNQKSYNWEKIVFDFKSSGLRQVDYARKHDLNPEHLSYYYRKHIKTNKNDKFIAVNIAKKFKTTPDNLIVKTPSGYELTIPFKDGDEKLQIIKIFIGSNKC